ncbi:MAG: phosphate acetyltransferase [Acidobacteria bacterium]|nr:phosphate acetyltransferase [Acidobacteriota bacterium]
MSEFLSSLVERARALQKRIVFPEGDDPRVRAAAARLAAEKVARPIVVSTNTQCDPGVSCIDPSQSSNIERYARIYHERRRSRGVTEQEARRIALQPIYFASLGLAAGDADGLVGGAANTTAETVRALIHCVGVARGARLVSSFMIQEQPNKAFGHNGVLIFADPAVVPQPTPSQLAEIAISAGRNARKFLDTEPRVAMLSFSTKGSAKHPLVEQVLEAVRIIKARAPELAVDGELQADAALIPSVGASKSPGSPVAGRANVMVFPDLNAANIGYKLAERMGGAQSMGPFLQGLEKPGNDLSRGASVESIYYTAVVTALQAGASD